MKARFNIGYVYQPYSFIWINSRSSGVCWTGPQMWRHFLNRNKGSFSNQWTYQPTAGYHFKPDFSKILQGFSWKSYTVMSIRLESSKKTSRSHATSRSTFMRFMHSIEIKTGWRLDSWKALRTCPLFHSKWEVAAWKTQIMRDGSGVIYWPLCGLIEKGAVIWKAKNAIILKA